MDFWQESHTLKEAYREKTFLGFKGAETRLTFAEVGSFLANASAHLDAAIAKSKTGKGITTYFAYEAVNIVNMHYKFVLKWSGVV